jgi:hypothetical protein
MAAGDYIGIQVFLVPQHADLRTNRYQSLEGLQARGHVLALVGVGDTGKSHIGALLIGRQLGQIGARSRQ